MSETEKVITIPRWTAAGVLIPLLIMIGALASPRDASNRAMLLSPAVREMLIYQDAAVRWLGEFREIDSAISMVLDGTFGNDLYSKTEKINRALSSASSLYKEIERQGTPATAQPFRASLVETASAYLDAARSALVWSTAGNEENLVAAHAALDAARLKLSELEASEWLTNPKP